MHRAVAAIGALAVTLALFFLMQLLISADGRDVPRPVAGAGVGLVTLLRDSADSSAQRVADSLLPPMPAPAAGPPTPPPPTMAQIAAPAALDLITDIPAPETPSIDALPFIGELPVTTAKKSVQPAKTKVAQKKTSTQKSTRKKPIKRSRSAAAKASPIGHGRSTGKKASGTGRGSGGKRGGGRNGRRAKSAGDSGVVVLSRSKPTYPRKALRNKKEGWVKVSFTITEKGTVTNPKVVAAKPRRVFDRSALKAISKWRFKPKTVGGKPVRTKATQLIEFNLASR